MADRRDKVEQFLSMSRKRRQSIKLIEATRLRQPKRISPLLSEEQILDYLRERDVCSQRKLEKLGKVDDSAPSLYRVKKVFGSWERAKKEAFSPHIQVSLEKSDESIIRLVSDFRIGTRKEYLERRRSNPSMFPSYHELRCRFGCWGNLKVLACSRQTDNLVQRYWLLRKQIGKWPTNTQCTDAGIDIYTLLDRIGGRAKLRETVIMFMGADI